MPNGSLVVVGLGIKFMSHLTTEAKAYIEQSDVVLYLVNEPLMKEWIRQSNPNTESLDSLYTKYRLRSECYQEISNYILNILATKKHVCVVLYGHPMVFTQPVADAVKQAQKDGYYAKVLPAISAEDCLFADLLVNPGSTGCQTFEATDLLIHRRPISPYSHLILWQVGMLGILTHTESTANTSKLKLLVAYLAQYYELEHTVIVYEAAQYPSFEPRIEGIVLEELPNTLLSQITTLYIPPISKSACDQDMLKALEIDIMDLK